MGLKEIFTPQVLVDNSIDTVDISEIKKNSGGTWVATKDSDTEWVAKKVSAQWTIEEANGFVIKDKSAQKMVEFVTAYSSLLRQINSSENGSMSKTEQKKKLNKEMASALKILFGYIQEKIFPDTNTEPYMRDFGFTRSAGNYIFPSTEIERVQALRKLINGLALHGLEDKTLGKEYWNGILNEFDGLISDRGENTGEKRVLIDRKNVQKEELKRYLKAIKHMLSAVYDNSTKELHAALADWGYKYFY